MGLRINTNIASLTGRRHLGGATGSLEGSYRRLASGERIAIAADDAAGLAISERMRARLKSMRVGQRNLQDGVSLVQVAEGALNELNEILQRGRELALQSANGTMSDGDREVIDRERQELSEEALRISQNVEFNGIPLFRSASTIEIQAGTNDSVDDTIPIELREVSRVGFLLGGMDFRTEGGALSSLDQFDLGQNIVNEERGRLGAVQNRLESAVRSLQVSTTDLAATESRIRDADVAQETAQLARAQILQQSSTLTLSQANVAPELALQLLG